MKEFVLDASTALAWAFASEATAATRSLFEAVVEGATACVPALWHLEVANVLNKARRKGRIDAAGIERFLAGLSCYDIEVDGETHAFAWTKTLGLAEKFSLTAYDAAYLELALRRGLPLASLDRSLCSAVESAGGRLALT